MDNEKNGNKENISILYGSETGYSIEVCERVRIELYRAGYKVVEFCSMDEFDKSKLIESITIIFVCSTCGEGDIPNNMKIFYRSLLKKSLPPNFLKNLSFSVFGLGDSSYMYYNFCAKKLFRRLVQLGANPILELSEGDDQHYLGVEGGLTPYITKLLVSLHNENNLTTNGIILNDKFALPEPRFKLLETKLNGSKQTDNNLKLDNGWVDTKLVKKEQLVKDIGNKETYLLKFESLEKLGYEPGDVASILPSNSEEDVDEFFAILNLQDKKENYYSIDVRDQAFKLPNQLTTPIQLYQLITEHIDLKRIPSRVQLLYLSKFTDFTLHKEKLQSFIEAENYDEYLSFIIRPKRTLLEVIQDFNTLQFDLNYLFETFAMIQPRKYSIGSYDGDDGNFLEVAVGVVNYKTILKKRRIGLTSQYVQRLNEGVNIPIQITKGTMQLPPSHHPIIMIGPGLGVLPFRSFLHKRIQLNQYQNYLYFTGWYLSKDQYFADELKSYHSQDKLVYRAAGSRDIEGSKQYVMGLMLEDKEMLADLLLNKNAYVYVCGSSGKMPKNVKTTLIQIITSYGNGVDGENYLNGMLKSNRYQQEVW